MNYSPHEFNKTAKKLYIKKLEKGKDFSEYLFYNPQLTLGPFQEFNRIIKCVEKEVFKNSGQLFGGYVHDRLAEKMFTTMDIFFPSIEPFEKIQEFLHNGEHRCTLARLIIELRENNHCIKFVLVSKKYSDIFLKGEMMFGSYRLCPLDLDINYLVQDENKISICPAKEKTIDIKTVLRNIQNRRFSVLNGKCNPVAPTKCQKISRNRLTAHLSCEELGCEECFPNCPKEKTLLGEFIIDRIEAFEEKGWTMKQHRCPNEKCMLHPFNFPKVN